MRFLTFYCLINELAISLLVVSVTIDRMIAMAILVDSINLKLGPAGGKTHCTKGIIFHKHVQAVPSHHSHDNGDEARRNVFRLRRLAIASPP